MCGTIIKNIFSVGLCLLMYNNSNAQIDRHALHITEENGLSDNNIECIYKDHNNFFWIGTASGLNLMDGSAITVFKNIPGDKTSINNNHILSLAEDKYGNLWVGTMHGLNLLNPVTRKFTTIPLAMDCSSRTETVSGIAINKPGQLYLATSMGLCFFDPATKKSKLIEIPGGDKFKSNQVSHLAFDHNGLLYLTTYNGLWSYDEHSNQFLHEIVSPTLFTNFIFDHEENLWIGTWDMGLFKWNPKENKKTSYSLPNSVSNILAIAEVPGQSGYSIRTNAFLVNSESVEKSIIPVPKSTFGNTRAMLFSPADDRLWIGSNQGLYLMRESTPNFVYHYFGHSITSQNVSILEWNHQYLVGGGGNDFLKRFDNNLNEVENYSRLPYKSIECLAIETDGKNNIKCGTSNGVADIDLESKKIVFHHLVDSSAIQHQLEFINCIFKDSRNTWWLFPWRNGIWTREANATGAKKVFNNFLTSFGQPKPLVISDACEDRHGNLWLSDYDEGIILYNRNTHTFSKPFADSLGQLVSCGQILYQNNYCYSFLSTTLLIWNTDSVILHKVPLLPLRDKTINSIALDSTGHVWLATQNGLVVYDIREKTLLHFTTGDGLTSNQLNGTLYCGQEGTVIFGGPLYLFSFKPETLLKYIHRIPQIALSEVIVDNTPYEFNAAGNNSFTHTKNNFVFRWTVTDYTDPMNNHYYYQLEGIDKRWRTAGTKGEAEFANLSPGKYTLLLKGENSNGVTANKILKMQFVILPPFWNTWWFITLLFMFVAAFFYTLYRYSLNQLMKVEKLRDKISLNLHDDIGSTLSSISILSEMALHRNADNESGKMIEEIKENSLLMMDRMDDIVWSINPKNDSLEDLFVRIRAFAGRLFEAKEIEYNISIDETIQHVQLDMEYRQQIYLIMKEAINNIVKHASCTEASLAASYDAPYLNIIISDNGKGIPDGRATGGNGLYNMKKRASEIKGALVIQTGINRGTTIHLKAKIK